MTYRLIVDGNLYSRRGVFNENLLASAINTSSINGYNNTIYTNSILNIGNNTKTINFGVGGDTPSDINLNGNCNINGSTIIYGSFMFPNTLEFSVVNSNVNIGVNQTEGNINIGNSNVNTIINGNTTTLASNSDKCVNAITYSDTAIVDFKSYGSNMSYDTRIISTGGNSVLDGKGICTIISDTLNIPSNINSNNTNNQVNLFTSQSTGGNINMGNSAAGIILNAANTSVIGNKLVVPNNVSSNTPGSVVNLFTDQTAGGNINMGNSAAGIILNADNTSVIGNKLVVPNNLSSNTPGSVVNLFTDQTAGGNINIGSSNSDLIVNGTSKLGFTTYSFPSSKCWNSATGNQWVLLGTWTSINDACRLKLIIWGDRYYVNNNSPTQGTNAGYEIIVYATMLNNTDTSARNLDTNYSIIGSSSDLPVKKIVFQQDSTNRLSYSIYALFNEFASTYVTPFCTRSSVYTPSMNAATPLSTTSSGTNIVMDINNSLIYNNLNGNGVGINTRSPTSTLHVNGQVNIDGSTAFGNLNLSPSSNAGEAAIGFYQNPSKGGAKWTMGTGGTGGFADDTFGIYSGTLGSTILTLKNTGRIGIGTKSPKGILEITGNNSTSKTAIPDGGENHNIVITGTKTPGTNSDGTSKTVYAAAFGVDYETGHTYINAAGNNEFQPILLNSRGGNVGIGTRNKVPIYALDIRNDGGTGGDNTPYIRLTGNGSPGNNVGIHLTPLKERSASSYDEATSIKAIDDGLYSAHLSFWTAPGGAINTTSSERMRITSSGNVGIGTSSPSYPLHITSTVTSPSFTYSYFSGTTGSYTGSGPISLYLHGRIVTTEVNIPSDIRIKKNIYSIENGLTKIRLFNPVRFQYIDNLKKSNKEEYGFIAQEIKNNIPNLISEIEDYIPNIYSINNVNLDIITFNNLYDININDELKLYDISNNEIIVKIIEKIDEKNIKIDKIINFDNIFIYGKKINDLNIIDKHAIFTYGIVAIKELDIIVQSQQETINKQQETINKQQEIINKQQETINNQQDTINKQQEEIKSLKDDIEKIKSILNIK